MGKTDDKTGEGKSLQLDSLFLMAFFFGLAVMLFLLLVVLVPPEYIKEQLITQDAVGLAVDNETSRIINDKLLKQLGLIAGTFLTVSLASLSLGFILAQILSLPSERIINRSIHQVTEGLNNFSPFSKWHGRRFMELLRHHSFSEIRREFLSLNLDVTLRVDDNSPSHYIDRLSTVLYALEKQAEIKGSRDLFATAEAARNLVSRFNHLRILHRVIFTAIYSVLPVLTLFGLSYLVDRYYLVAASDLNSNLAILNLNLSVACFFAAPIGAYIIGKLVYILTWNIGKRTSTELDDLAFVFISWLFAAAAGITLLLISLHYSNEWPVAVDQGLVTIKHLLVPFMQSGKEIDPGFLAEFSLSQKLLLRVAVIVLLTIMMILLLLSLCRRVLRDMAAKTEDKFDDMAVELLRIFGTFVVGAMGLGWIFMFIVSDVNIRMEGAGAVMPYVILVAVIGAVLGIASRDMLENFFAGLSLQIDKSFEYGERVELESGDICLVKDIGLRHTRFYNLVENSEQYVPNSLLAKQIIKNLSRPDRQCLAGLKVQLSGEQATSSPGLIQAEGLMLLAALVVDGIDSTTIRESELKDMHHLKNRRGVLDEYERVRWHNENIGAFDMVINNGVESIDDIVRNTCENIAEWKKEIKLRRTEIWNNSEGCPANNFPEDLFYLAKKAHCISHAFQTLELVMYKLGSCGLATEVEGMALELLRAPRVKSSFVRSDGGSGVWELELTFYAYLNEQRFEIVHYLNLLIQRLISR